MAEAKIKNAPGQSNGSSSKKTIPHEFTERVARLLLICIEGVRGLLPPDAPLYSRLDDLGRVVRKVVRTQPASDLGLQMEDYFKQLKLEGEFEEKEKEDLKNIVLSLTQANKDMLSAFGEFDQGLGDCVSRIQSAETLKDILAVKDVLLKETQENRTKTQSMKNELEKYREATEDLSKRLEQSEQKALMDPLTRVLNRNAYNVRVGQVVREFERYKDPSALVVLDIDHFKKFNDTYGHKTGDQVIRSVASSIQSSIRQSDLVFRYGGEEFAVLLNKITLDDAKKVAEKIRRQVEKDYFVDQEKELRVTASLGLTVIKEGDTETTFFERADQAMYNAKQGGRNRVEVLE